MAAIPDNDLRLRLRVAVKLLIAGALCACAAAALGFALGDPEFDPATRRIRLTGLAPGEARMAGWHGRPLLIVRRGPEAMAALPDTRRDRPAIVAVYARGTAHGCPVVWEAQRHRFRESCGDALYDPAGRPLAPGYAPLARPPYRIVEGGLVLGRGR